MKKYFTLLLVSLLMISQKSEAQLSPALVNNFAVNFNISPGYRLTWDVANNESVSSFEVEKSTDGKDFTSIAVIIATEKKGAEVYQFSGTVSSNDKVMFRLKTTNNAHRVYYSNILIAQMKKTMDNKIRIVGNPVSDKLTFSYSLSANEINVKIINLSGKVLHSQKINNTEANKILNIPLNSSFAPGLYIVEINNGIESQSSKFVKQ